MGHFETERVRADGRRIRVSLTISPIRDKDGAVVGASKVARDVTDQRAMERKLEEERQYSRSLVECSPDALLISDPDFVVTDLNERAVEFSGYTRPELIGARLAVLSTDPNRAAERVRAALENGDSVKLSGFGNFQLRNKPQRPGRNPKTGEEIPITARRVVTFHASQKLKALVDKSSNGAKPQES